MEPLDVKNLTKGMVVGGTLCIRALLTGAKDLIFHNTNNDFKYKFFLRKLSNWYISIMMKYN